MIEILGECPVQEICDVVVDGPEYLLDTNRHTAISDGHLPNRVTVDSSKGDSCFIIAPQGS